MEFDRGATAEAIGVIVPLSRAETLPKIVVDAMYVFGIKLFLVLFWCFFSAFWCYFDTF